MGSYASRRSEVKTLAFSFVVAIVASLLVLLPSWNSDEAVATGDPGYDSEIDYYVDIAGSSAITTSGSPIPTGNGAAFSVEAWVKPDTISGYNTILAQGNVANVAQDDRFYLGLYSPGSGTFVHIGRSATAYANVSVDNLAGRWVHVAATVAGDDQINLYVDGRLIDTVTLGNGGTNVGFGIGSDEKGNGPFDGHIDQVKIWDGVLEADEIEASMHSLSIPTSGVDNSLLSHWDFNEGAEPTIFDRVGSHDLTANNVSFADVKQVTANSDGDTVITFPRTYLPGVGGWTVPENATDFKALVVGGGGAGGSLGYTGASGGGGGGQVLTGSVAVSVAQTLSIVVGQGGVATPPASVSQVASSGDGQRSLLGTGVSNLEALGGGGGANTRRYLEVQGVGSLTGWTGGGGSVHASNASAGSTGVGGVSLRAGNAYGGSADAQGGGGGGGAGGAGTDANSVSGVASAGNGGAGISSDISGASVTFGGGGGGGKRFTGQSGLGFDGGGAGGASTSGTAGTQNRGGGGGGSGGNGPGGGDYSLLGASGGSGVVILRYTPTNDLAYTAGAKSDLFTSTTPLPTANNAAFTAEAWVYSSATPGTSWRTILGGAADLNSNLNRFLVAVREGYGVYVDVAGAVNSYVDVGFQLEQWTHVAISVTASSNPTVNLFIDGALVHSWSGSYNRTTLGQYFTIGSGTNADYLWSGQIDQVKIWGSVLDAADIAESMHSYQKGTLTAGDSLLAHYDFNDFTQGVVLDRTGNGKHLTLASSITDGRFTSSQIIETGTVHSEQNFVKFNRSYLTALGGWVPPAGVTSFDGAAVAGGGGGTSRHGGGGGAGELVIFENANLGSQPIPIVVGQGGLGVDAVASVNPDTSGSSGQRTLLGQISLSGGGFGSSDGGKGGSGAGGQSSNFPPGVSSVSSNTGAYQFFGNSGGLHTELGAWAGGGGGGAGSAGYAAGATGGNGGDGKTVNFTGTPLCLAAGGGGGADASKAGGDGGSCSDSGLTSGGEGSSGYPTPVAATASGVPNTGSGGGGGGHTGSGSSGSGNGSSGVVILAYSLAPDAPTSLTATQSTSHATINLSWTAPSYTGNSAITDYDIEYKPSGGSWTSYSDGVSTATTRAVELPTQCVAHEFRVIAKNASFGSAASGTASATPVWGTFDSLTGVQISSTNSECLVQFTSTNTNAWTPPSGTDTVRALVVGGGGGGGSAGDSVPAGGGGAGGFIETVVSGLQGPVDVHVGAGGAGGGASYWSSGLNGEASTFSSLTAIGGGGGGGRANAGLAGGSGGGSGGRVANTGGLGFESQGFNGGSVAAAFSGGGGGGGAGSAGAPGGASAGGAGGVGSYSFVVGQMLSAGGAGGSENSATNGSTGQANTGNGGGGGGVTGPQANGYWSYGGAGGSGLVAIRQISGVAPTIMNHPQSSSAEPGDTKTFSVSASGNGTLSYQWQSSTDGTNWSNLGTDSSSFTTQTLALADDGIQFRVIVTNTLNGQTSQATSNIATLTVTGATITSGGCSALVGDDTGVTISETANGGCLVKYTEPGSNTFFVPNLVSSLQAYIVGGGGGGGGAKLGEGGGGGGGGGASRLVTVQVTTSQVIPITVAAGGAGGNANSNGSDGGTSAFSASYTTPGGKGGKTPTSWPGGGGEGGTGAAGQAYVSSGYSGGNGATDPGDRSYYQPKYGGGGSWRSFAGQLWCVGGGGGGGNREVANDPYFHWEPRAQTCSNGVGVSGGSGGWHNGTTNVLATPGVANTGGGGGGGSYDSSLSIARGGADGADGLVAIYFTPSTGEISLSSVAAFSFSNTTKTITLTKDNPTSDVTWTTSNTAVCTVTGNSTSATVTPHGGGLCEVSVAVAAQSPYARGSAATSFQIDKMSGTAPTWVNNSATVPFGGTLNLRAQISNPGSNAYTFSTSGTAGSCSVTGYTLTVGNVGDTCNVVQTLIGDATTLDMEGVTPLSVTVTKISQSALLLTSATSMNVNQTLTLSAAGGSGTGALSYHVANQGSTGCVVNSSTGALTASGSGDCEVYAQRALSTNYDPVTSSHVVVTVNKVSQNLSWLSQPQAQYLAGQTYALEATASSQLTVAYSISSGLCTLAGSTVTFTGSGDCVILAGQPGDNSYLPAVTISQTVSVGKINQTMTFSALADVSWGSLAFSLSATASSGLNIAYSESNQTTNDACDVSTTGIVTIKNVGTCAITATQAGNAAYTAVTTTRLFEVTANQAGAPFIGSVSFGDRQLNASFFTPSYLGGGTVSAYELRAYELNGILASTNTGCIANQGATQSCSVIGLDNGKKYVLRVAAITQAGLGQFSASSSEIIPAANPEAVGNLIAIEGNGTLSLQWTEPTSFGGANFFQYRIYWKAPGQQYQADGSPGATVGTQASTSYVITGLTNGVAYDVKIVTATSNNNVELQSNTAEVRQTPFTVPDAPAAVVALDNNNNVVVAWQPPVFDGGNPIDQYVVTKGNATVCTITSATTTSCEVTRPAPGSTEVIQVRAGNDAGLSAPASTSITIQAVQGSSTQIVGGGGVSLPGITPNTPAPIVLDVSGSAVVKTNQVVRLVGTNLNLVEKVLVGNTEASFFVNSAELITIRIPIEVAAGKPVITLQGAFGSRIFANLIEVTITPVSIDTKVTIGTFLGYAAVYTKNHEGKRLSMKIGSKWRVIESLGSDYTYNFTKVGKGKTVTVMVYLDRQLVQVKQIKIQ